MSQSTFSYCGNYVPKCANSRQSVSTAIFVAKRSHKSHGYLTSVNRHEGHLSRRRPYGNGSRCYATQYSLSRKTRPQSLPITIPYHDHNRSRSCPLPTQTSHAATSHRPPAHLSPSLAS